MTRTRSTGTAEPDAPDDAFRRRLLLASLAGAGLLAGRQLAGGGAEEAAADPSEKLLEDTLGPSMVTAAYSIMGLYKSQQEEAPRGLGSSEGRIQLTVDDNGIETYYGFVGQEAPAATIEVIRRSDGTILSVSVSTDRQKAGAGELHTKVDIVAQGGRIGDGPRSQGWYGRYASIDSDAEGVDRGSSRNTVDHPDDAPNISNMMQEELEFALRLFGKPAELPPVS